MSEYYSVARMRGHDVDVSMGSYCRITSSRHGSDVGMLMLS